MNAPKRILYADDDEDSCAMMAALLGQFGYETLVVQTTASALKLAQTARFDLYVIDNHFPDGTGAELCRQIRRFDVRTPLIIYSGTSTEADLKEALRAGAQAYILKPYIEELLQSIVTALYTS